MSRVRLSPRQRRGAETAQTDGGDGGWSKTVEAGTATRCVTGSREQTRVPPGYRTDEACASFLGVRSEMGENVQAQAGLEAMAPSRRPMPVCGVMPWLPDSSTPGHLGGSQSWGVEGRSVGGRRRQDELGWDGMSNVPRSRCEPYKNDLPFPSQPEAPWSEAKRGVTPATESETAPKGGRGETGSEARGANPLAMAEPAQATSMGAMGGIGAGSSGMKGMMMMVHA